MRTINIALIILVLILIMICLAPQEEQKEPDTPALEKETRNETIKNEFVIDTREKEDTINNKEQEEEPEKEPAAKKLTMFHNSRGPMCLEQLKFLEDIKPQYPLLVIEEHLTTGQGTRELLNQLKSEYDKSEGMSDNFGYLPITFINNHAYSGFNSEVKEKLEKDIEEIS